MNKKFFMVLVASLLLVLGMGTVLAEGDPFAPTEGTPADDPNYGEGSVGGSGLFLKDNKLNFSTKSLQYISYGTNAISNLGNDMVGVNGKTQANQNVSTIGVALDLQIWNASQNRWDTAIHVGSYEKYNTNTIHEGNGVGIVPGYYYRTRSYHYVFHGDRLKV